MRIRISAGILTKERGHAKPSPHSWLASAQCVVRCAVPLAWGTFLSWRGAIKPLFNTISGEDLVTVFSSSGSMMPFFFFVSPSFPLPLPIKKKKKKHAYVEIQDYIALCFIYYFTLSSNTFTNISHLQQKQKFTPSVKAEQHPDEAKGDIWGNEIYRKQHVMDLGLCR